MVKNHHRSSSISKKSRSPVKLGRPPKHQNQKSSSMTMDQQYQKNIDKVNKQIQKQTSPTGRRVGRVAQNQVVFDQSQSQKVMGSRSKSKNFNGQQSQEVPRNKQPLSANRLQEVKENEKFYKGKNHDIEIVSNDDYHINNSKHGTEANSGLQSHPAISMPQSLYQGGPFSAAFSKMAIDQDILDYSPFNFYHGINIKRLMKGKCQLGKTNLIANLSCSFCQNVIVQGKECPQCEQNFCQPCTRAWEASESAKYFQTPCKCENVKKLRNLNKLKTEYLGQIRFKCNNNKCGYQLTYEELILGTHELDDCLHMKIACDGCGMKISKSEQIRHDTMQCENPVAKCKFCAATCHLKDLQTHMKVCNQRALVKMEYFPSQEYEDDDIMQDEPSLDQHQKRSTKSFDRKKSSQPLEFRDFPGQIKSKELASHSKPGPGRPPVAKIGRPPGSKNKNKDLIRQLQQQANFNSMSEQQIHNIISSNETCTFVQSPDQNQFRQVVQSQERAARLSKRREGSSNAEKVPVQEKKKAFNNEAMSEKSPKAIQNQKQNTTIQTIQTAQFTKEEKEGNSELIPISSGESQSQDEGAHVQDQAKELSAGGNVTITSESVSIHKDTAKPQNQETQNSVQQIRKSKMIAQKNLVTTKRVNSKSKGKENNRFNSQNKRQIKQSAKHSQNVQEKKKDDAAVVINSQNAAVKNQEQKEDEQTKIKFNNSFNSSDKLRFTEFTCTQNDLRAAQEQAQVETGFTPKINFNNMILSSQLQQKAQMGVNEEASSAIQKAIDNFQVQENTQGFEKKPRHTSNKSNASYVSPYKKNPNNKQGLGNKEDNSVISALTTNDLQKENLIKEVLLRLQEVNMIGNQNQPDQMDGFGFGNNDSQNEESALLDNQEQRSIIENVIEKIGQINTQKSLKSVKDNSKHASQRIPISNQDFADFEESNEKQIVTQTTKKMGSQKFSQKMSQKTATVQQKFEIQQEVEQDDGYGDELQEISSAEMNEAGSDDASLQSSTRKRQRVAEQQDDFIEDGFIAPMTSAISAKAKALQQTKNLQAQQHYYESIENSSNNTNVDPLMKLRQLQRIQNLSPNKQQVGGTNSQLKSSQKSLGQLRKSKNEYDQIAQMQAEQDGINSQSKPSPNKSGRGRKH